MVRCSRASDVEGGAVRVLIVEDSVIMRERIADLLSEFEKDIELVAQAQDAPQGLEAIRTLEPDVVILDIRMPGVNGIEATRRIRAAQPDTRVLIVSAYDDDLYVQEARGAGASGYLLKTAPSRELLNAVRAVGEGATVLQDEVSLRLLHARREHGPELSERELEIVRLLARGRANKEIARELGISPRTVEGHVNNVFAKFGVSSRVELVLAAMRQHLVALDQEA